jgi:hypothetical protein
MAINQISNANTFGQMVVATSALIAVANNLTDGPNLVSNTTLTMTYPGVALNVSPGRVLFTTANVTTANVTLLTGNCTTQFDPAGQGMIMAIVLG